MSNRRAIESSVSPRRTVYVWNEGSGVSVGRTNEGSGVGPVGAGASVGMDVGLGSAVSAADGSMKPAGGGTHPDTAAATATAAKTGDAAM